MASALVGRLADILGNDLERGIHARYAARMYEWQERAERHIRRNVGVVKGLALHYWHGSKVNRKYGSRKKILIDCEYNPETDLKRDWQGVYQLSDQFTDRSQKLRDHVRKYFRERNEDA
jgi:hypothetical protein